MTFKSDILTRFNGEAGARPFYLPDLTLWYDWHSKKGSLPPSWANAVPSAATIRQNIKTSVNFLNMVPPFYANT